MDSIDITWFVINFLLLLLVFSPLIAFLATCSIWIISDLLALAWDYIIVKYLYKDIDNDES